IETLWRNFIAADWGELNDRALERRVGEGHGDLRAEHICVLDDTINVIDCVEFSERLRYGDVASDIAFLAMDLDRLGASRLADEFVEAFAEIARDDELPIGGPFFKCYRARARGQVASLRSLQR